MSRNPNTRAIRKTIYSVVFRAIVVRDDALGQAEKRSEITRGRAKLTESSRLRNVRILSGINSGRDENERIILREICNYLSDAKHSNTRSCPPGAYKISRARCDISSRKLQHDRLIGYHLPRGEKLNCSTN